MYPDLRMTRSSHRDPWCQTPPISRKPCQAHLARGAQAMWAQLSSLFHGSEVPQEPDTSHQPCAATMLRCDRLQLILQKQHPLSFQTPTRRRPGRHCRLQCSASCTVTPGCPNPTSGLGVLFPVLATGELHTKNHGIQNGLCWK